MLELLLYTILVLVIVAAFNAESFNPFTIIKTMFGYIGFGVGATPKLLETGKVIATELKKESELELAKSGRANDVSFRANRMAGHKAASEVCDPILDKSRANIKDLDAELAKIYNNK